MSMVLNIACSRWPTSHLPVPWLLLLLLLLPPPYTPAPHHPTLCCGATLSCEQLRGQLQLPGSGKDDNQKQCKTVFFISYLEQKDQVKLEN